MKSCSWPVFGASERNASCLLSADHAISCSSCGALPSPAVIRLFRRGSCNICHIDRGVWRWRAAGARQRFDPGHALAIRRNFGLLKIAHAEHGFDCSILRRLWRRRLARRLCLRTRAKTYRGDCRQHCDCLNRLRTHTRSNPPWVRFSWTRRRLCAADMLSHAARNINRRRDRLVMKSIDAYSPLSA